MKRTFILMLALLFSGALMAQPIFDVGLKAGLNFSKVSMSSDDYNSESVTKAHIGAFGRIGWARMYLQPEVYYSAKGGRVIESGVNPIVRAAQFDFSTVDVPVLLGIKVLKGGPANLRVMAGPVFCLMTSKKMDSDELLERQYYNDHYLGYQYGVGVDFLNFFVDARMEHSINRLYYQSAEDLGGKARTFMITAGFKIL
ncbi:MAG: porin family protein [Bacteroidota bacterium]